ncbi:GIY-YIG nuclease family protein [Candidatus Dependentiae bacterium]|mgnify:CR=1 FL=1|nr:GIY-YIG nuclease family protein [Candidatus Dependentiae bacterium]MCC7415245.1 GIY-YIG nuclease family protein [Campylobacterota bacterium]
MHYYVYILSSKKNGTLYIGVTNNLARRLTEHKEAACESFTQKYGITQLVHVEKFLTAYEAIEREKKIKKWNRAWKIALIEENNIDWDDLSDFIEEEV